MLKIVLFSGSGTLHSLWRSEELILMKRVILVVNSPYSPTDNGRIKSFDGLLVIIISSLTSMKQVTGG